MPSQLLPLQLFPESEVFMPKQLLALGNYVDKLLRQIAGELRILPGIVKVTILNL